MKNVWDEILREIGEQGIITAILSLFFLISALIGFMYVCS
jgi:hypothetical protein